MSSAYTLNVMKTYHNAKIKVNAFTNYWLTGRHTHTTKIVTLKTMWTVFNQKKLFYNFITKIRINDNCENNVLLIFQQKISFTAYMQMCIDPYIMLAVGMYKLS